MKRTSEKLIVANVSKSFGEHRILDCVNFEINSGNVLTILGPNGAGKTTILKVISGLIGGTSGTISLEYKGQRKPLRRSDIGLLFEGNRTVYHKLTPLENITYFGVLKGLPRKVAKQRASELLELFNLKDKAKTVCQKLSRGMQQRLALAIAIVHKPKFVLLDEPTLGMDYKSLDIFKHYINTASQNGTAFIISTHQFEVAQLISSHTLLIKEGKVIASDKISAIFDANDNEKYLIKGLNTELTVQKSPEALIAGINTLGISNLQEISQTQVTLEALVRQKTDDALH